MLIIGIVVDGIRRMRRARAEALRLDVDPDFVSSRDELDNPELPNGGSRVVDASLDVKMADKIEPVLFEEEELTVDAEEEFSYIDNLVADPEASKVVMSEQPKVQARPVNLDEKVPVLLDVEELGAEEDQPQIGLELEEADSANETELDEALVEVAISSDGIASASSEYIVESEVEDGQTKIEHADVAVQNIEGLEEAQSDAEVIAEEQEVFVAPINVGHVDAERLSERENVEMTLVIHCITPMGQSLEGQQTAQLFNSCDLRLGEDNIVHRYEQAEGKGNIQFSVVHSYEPQTFSLEKFLDQSYHGFSFFMRLPGPKDPLQAYEAMVGLAKFLEDQFDADLYDADRSALTQQTIEHDRQQIIDFERRQQVAAKKLMRG